MADGSIIIDTRIDTGGVSKGMNAVKAGMARISAQVSKMGDSAKSSFQRQITAITGLYQNYEKQERKVSELKSKLEELSKVRIETEEYKKLKDDIKALEDEFEKVETKQREWLDMGFSIDSAPLQELDKQMDDIWADIDRLQRKQKEMQTTGRAYVDPTSTDAYKSTAEKCNVESQKLEHINGRLYSSYNKLKNKVEEYRQKNSRLVQVMQNLQKAAARVGMVVKNMGSALRRAGSAIKSMVSAMKKAVENMFNLNKQTDRSRMSLSRMLGMSLLFSGVSRAISAVSDGVKSGFENLAQYSNSTNSAISSLMSSMTRLKNSFATAFAPVLTVVAPIMSRFIDMISRAITSAACISSHLRFFHHLVKQCPAVDLSCKPVTSTACLSSCCFFPDDLSEQSFRRLDVVTLFLVAQHCKELASRWDDCAFTLHDALMIAQYYYECGLYVQFTMSLCIEWLFLFVRDDPRYSPPQQKSWYTKCTEEYPEITAMLESEQRSEIIGTLRRMPQNFLFKGLPDDIKDDYKLMDF